MGTDQELTQCMHTPMRMHPMHSWAHGSMHMVRGEGMAGHTYIRTYVRTYIRTYVHTDIRTYVHTDIRTYVHTCRHGGLGSSSESRHSRDSRQSRESRHSKDASSASSASAFTGKIPPAALKRTASSDFLGLYMHICIHTHIHAYMHTCIHAYRRPQAQSVI